MTPPQDPLQDGKPDDADPRFQAEITARRERRSPVPPARPEAGAGTGAPTGPGGGPDRLYILTGEDTERAPIDLVTLIVAKGDPSPTAQPEHSTLLRLCRTPLSAAELSAYMALPYSVVTVLLTELLAADLVHARAPVVRSALPDRSLLEAVMHGLQKL
ncbi:DUF742 domain-containing protein [Streptomyces silvensis]|uniref:DUF742 domain-containing protein n=1 Tax=Streptomyces silvensis TaxID=1765722 RepID=UPI00099EE869|nr:DUF742 domain-containing protein [Streptomyces silvensis]